MRRLSRAALSLALAAGSVAVLAAPRAGAHFILKAPASWMSQDLQGSPQKTYPCGNEGGGTATGSVTPYKPGDTVTITIDETVFHPGHYRVALAVNDRSELPPEPPVTPGATACGSTVIQSPPVFPILADGQLLHSQSFSAPQTFTVTLPTNVTCTHCTLQVLEFMSSHGAPCFYHHCADIAITADGSGGRDASAPVASDAATPMDASAPASGSPNYDFGPHDSGCASSPGRAQSPAALCLAGVFGLGVWLRRRRRVIVDVA